MSDYQGSESVRYPSCVFNYGNGKLISIGFEGELYVRQSKNDERFERMGRRIAELEQKVEDLEGMLGELPPEGKCAMLLVQHVDGEYVWACRQYDLASYLLVDLDADTFTGSVLNDMFGRADWGDELAMARELRKMADELNREGDVLGILGGDVE